LGKRSIVVFDRNKGCKLKRLTRSVSATVVMLCLLCSTQSMAIGQENETVSEGILVASEGPYKVIRPPRHKTTYGEKRTEKLMVMYEDRVIYEYNPHIFTDGVSNGSLVLVDLAYDSLIERKSVQPIAFSDITGDGHPDLVFKERPPAGNSSAPYALVVLSLNADTYVEYEPLKSSGEVVYFHDFNDDGKKEIVMTDQERYFLYDRDGIPISSSVWLCDPDYKRYYQATEMII
jgi:hypothetical protein